MTEGVDPVLVEIAARYRAGIAPGVVVQRIPAGKSARPDLVWDGDKLVETGPTRSDRNFTFGKGKGPKPVEVPGHRWPSQGACAAALGVTPAAVAQAVRKGKLREMVARHLGPLRQAGGGG